MNDALVAVASMSEARRQRSDIEHQISICMVNTRLAVLEGRSVDQARRVREVLQGEANNGPPPGPDDFECVLTALWPADQRPAYCRQQRTTVVARAFTPRAPEQNDNCTLPELQEGIEMIDAQIAELGDAFRRRFNADPRVILQVSREEMVACATTPESDRCRAAHAQLVAMLAGRTPPELLMRNVAATPSRPSHYGTE